jgi:hypothetical protein
MSKFRLTVHATVTIEVEALDHASALEKASDELAGFVVADDHSPRIEIHHVVKLKSSEEID